MKKFLFLGALAAMLLGTASCSNEMEPEMTDGTVQFKVELPGAIDSRAIADGTTATKLEVACYDAAGNVLTTLNPEIVGFENRVATVTMKLVKNQHYKFAFFAHAEGAPYTFNKGAKFENCTFTVTDNYTGAACVSNAENRDAFYAVLEDYVVTPETKVVTLTRPFAQLNFGADDVTDAANAGITPTQSMVTVKQVATSFNLSTGATDGAVDATFALAAIPTETLKVEDKNYGWMAMNYFLVPNNEANVDVEMTVKTKDANNAEGGDIVVPATNVPVKKNHRTNILGSLFTEEGNFQVIIDQRFDVADYNIDAYTRPFLPAGAIQIGVNGEQFNTIADAIAANTNGETIYLGAGTYDEAINVGAGETVKLASAGGLTAADVIIPQQVKTEAGATLGLTNVKITSDVHGGASVEAVGAGTHVVLNGVETSGRRGVNAGDGAEVIITNSKINADIDDNEGQYYNRCVNIYGNGTKVTVENSEVRCDSHYAFNYPGSADGTELTVKNCDVIGWGNVNIWGKNNNLSFDNCKFTSINVNSGLTNAFQAITIAQDAAINNNLSVKNSSFYIEAKGDQFQRFLKVSGTGNAFKFENVNVKGVRTLTPYLVGVTSAAQGNYTLEFDDNCTIDWSEE